MAQRETKSTQKEVSAKNERPSSIKLQASLSHPVTSISEKERKSNSRRHLTLPVPLNETYPQSDAERYVAFRTQMSISPNEQQDLSPETPLSTGSTNSRVSNNPLLAPITHAERMYKWQQEQTKKIFKKQKHRYVYGPPPTSSAFQFPSSIYLTPSTQLNLPLSSERNSIQQTRTIKKDNLIERPKTSETYNKIKISSTV